MDSKTNKLHSNVDKSSYSMVISYVNCDEEYEYNNHLFTDSSGAKMEDIDKLHIKDVMGKDAYLQIKPYLDKALSGEEQKFDFDWHKSSGSPPRLFNVTYTPNLDNDGNVIGIHITSSDVTEQRKLEGRFNALFQHSPNALLITNEAGKIEMSNEKAVSIFGYTQNELVGMKIEELIPERFRRKHLGHRKKYMKSMKRREIALGQNLTGLCKDGTEVPVEIALTPIESRSERLVMSTITDISERIKIETQLTHQASHDALTGLVNRREFEHRAERLLSTIRQNQSDHALCFMDLDQFKVVNDTCGHMAGNELLYQLSMVLQQVVRKSDTLARLGGDEFGVLMEHCSLDQARRVATSLQKAVQDYQFAWEGQSFRVGVSIGLAAITEATPNLTELLKQADAACYMAKDMGRNRIHVYHPEDSELAQRHGEMQWVTRIYQALEEDRFCLYAQAIIPLDNRTDSHYELLLRMKDEKGKIIPPGAFLPAAERYNLISNLDRWVVKNAFFLLAEHPTFLKQIHFVSINLSGQSLADETFLDFVIKQLQNTRIGGEKICFEITETAAISCLNKADKFIATLKQFGCSFALDDFGSGLSSFAYLKNLSVDYLKIDGMFVKDIVDDPIDRAMVKSINEIGQVMNMQTIAEFVENDEIKGMLREIGVNYAQGYGIGKPMPFDELLGRSSNVADIKSRI